MNKGIVVVVVLLATIAVGSGVWLATQNAMMMDTVNQAVPEVSASPDSSETMEVQPIGKVVEVVVEGSNFKFTPTKIEVNRGDTVRLTLKSSGMMHDLVIDELDVATSRLGDGEEEEIEFVASKVGIFEFYCSVGNHRAMGMKGTLVVN